MLLYILLKLKDDKFVQAKLCSVTTVAYRVGGSNPPEIPKISVESSIA